MVFDFSIQSTVTVHAPLEAASPSWHRRMRRIGASVVATAALFAGIWLVRPSTVAAQVPGCCYCDNCPQGTAPFCTDLMASSSSCVDLCIVQTGCQVIEFAQNGSCAAGCGSKPPYFSPTPTATPTSPPTGTPTNTPVPTNTPIPPPTPTPMYCCLGSNPARCGPAVPPNLPNCQAGEVPIADASCINGGCVLFTATPTHTRTPPPTFTPSSTPTTTPTRTPTTTPTTTLTPVLTFVVDPFHCYRVKATTDSKAKRLEVNVADSLGTTKKMLIKPFLECSPADVSATGASVDDPGVARNHEHLTCYKAKDLTRPYSSSITVRNRAEDEAKPLKLDPIKGDIVCLPSFVNEPSPSMTPAATATKPPPTATPASTSTPTTMPSTSTPTPP